MKCFLTLSCFFTLIVGAIAQPQINPADIISPGDKVYVTSPEGDAPDPGQAGANRVWDFSAVSVGPEIVEVNVARPDTTEYFTDYPTATLAPTVDFGTGQSIQYERASASLYEGLGFIIPGLLQEIYSNPVTIYEFPVAYNSQWDDTYSSNLVYGGGGITTESNGSLDAHVDGYGSLILPQATFDDVLRIKIISESTDTTDYGLGTAEKNVNNDTTYVWASPSYPYALATHSRTVTIHYAFLVTPDTVIVDQETLESTSFTFDPRAGSSAVHNVEPGRFQLSISPNPIERDVKLEFIAEKPDQMEFILQDLNGRVFFKDFLSAHAGENSFDVKLPEIPSGMYLAILNSASGGDIQKLVRIGSAR